MVMRFWLVLNRLDNFQVQTKDYSNSNYKQQFVFGIDWNQFLAGMSMYLYCSKGEKHNISHLQLSI